MDETTRRYFDELTRVRENGADLLEQPFMSGVQRTVVEKYSEPAHFVYELIQNADDAGATRARFILSDDQLIFAHNGSRHFTVSDPRTEREDRDAGTLGDVNSITAIALSNKTDEATIGKFGVGFKAVFTYTNTPHIYGPTLCFRIERFIVPKLLEEDHPNRKEEETLFVFPFDKPDVDNKIAVKEIADRLSSLVFPVLFLNSLQRIVYIAPSISGSYAESILEEHAYTYGERDVIAQLVGFDVGVQQGSNALNERLWLFSSSNEDGHKCSVGFFVSKDGNICPRQMPAFCFFPTKVTTGLQFIVNAPFLLTDSREGIRYGDDHNLAMVEELGELAAASLEILCDIGSTSGRRIVGDNMFDVIPYDSTYGFGYDHGVWYGRSSDSNTLSFRPIREALKSKIRLGTVLPGIDGYHRAKESCIVESAKMNELLGKNLLQDLTGMDSLTLNHLVAFAGHEHVLSHSGHILCGQWRVLLLSHP